MTDQTIREFQLGDRVRILHTFNLRGRIVELRGPLGPKGAQVYRIRMGPKGGRFYTEVLSEQMELLPPKVKS